MTGLGVRRARTCFHADCVDQVARGQRDVVRSVGSRSSCPTATMESPTPGVSDVTCACGDRIVAATRVSRTRAPSSRRTRMWRARRGSSPGCAASSTGGAGSRRARGGPLGRRGGAARVWRELVWTGTRFCGGGTRAKACNKRQREAAPCAADTLQRRVHGGPRRPTGHRYRGARFGARRRGAAHTPSDRCHGGTPSTRCAPPYSAARSSRTH